MHKKTLKETDPHLALEWHPTKNGDLRPEQVVSGSHKKVWWICSKKHEWFTEVRGRAMREAKCPYCAHVKVCKDNCLATVNPILAKEWCYQKNNGLTPNDFTGKSSKKVWWTGKCGHEWQSSIKNRANNSGCPYCDNSAVCIDNCLATTHPELCKEWHPILNKDITPFSVVPGSIKKAWWLGSCGHEWHTDIRNRTHKKANCPYCSNNKIGKDNNLLVKYPLIAAEWHPVKNNISPDKVAKCSGIKYWWLCAKCNSEWRTSIYARTSRKCGCPKCKNSSGEKQIKNLLINKKINFSSEYRNNTCKFKNCLPFDFAIFNENNGLIGLIEFQGQQHYKPVSIFGGVGAFESRKIRDGIKSDWAKENNIPLLIIPYWDKNIDDSIKSFVKELD